MVIEHVIELRPQPIGIFAFPAANLLLPSVEFESSSACQPLLRGNLDIELPEEWRFFAAAANGEVRVAMELLAGDSSPVADYNRFVLNPTRENLSATREVCSGPLREMLDVAAFSAGVSDTLPNSFTVDQELLCGRAGDQGCR